jgi:hypothetical protein
MPTQLLRLLSLEYTTYAQLLVEFLLRTVQHALDPQSVDKVPHLDRNHMHLFVRRKVNRNLDG